jgi:hypothetical protein
MRRWQIHDFRAVLDLSFQSGRRLMDQYSRPTAQTNCRYSISIGTWIVGANATNSNKMNPIGMNATTGIPVRSQASPLMIGMITAQL